MGIAPLAAEGAVNIEPPDVYAEVDLTRRELEELRWYMGRPKNMLPDMKVEAAAPREVYFQAITLLGKTDRLAFEQLREPPSQTDHDLAEPGPGDVMRLVEAARVRLNRVRANCGLRKEMPRMSRDPTKTPTDVFRSIVQANRQLDLLLDERMSPADVYRQVSACIGQASALLAVFPDAERLPAPPEFEPGKRPQDVYVRLIRCFQLLARSGRAKGVRMLDLREEVSAEEQVTPNDVYTIASLLLSELRHMHGQFPGAPKARPGHHVGRKLPSHVYQRAGMLELQLGTLARQLGVDTGAE